MKHRPHTAPPELAAPTALSVLPQLAVFSKHSFVYSNLPGFDRPIYVWGAPGQPASVGKVERIAAYYQNIVSQLIFLSYAGQLTVCLTTDPAALAKPQRLADLIAREVVEWEAEGKNGE